MLDNVERYWSPTLEFRWLITSPDYSRFPRLQQRWVERDSVYMDWAGPNEKFEWRDVPKEYV